MTAGGGRLDLSFNAVTGAILYEVHYTSAPEAGSGAVANNDAADTANVDPAVGWVFRTIVATTSTTITGLKGGTSYRVRVRASNATEWGPYVVGSGTPTTPRAQDWQATLSVKDLGSVQGAYRIGCLNSHDTTANKCSTTGTLSSDRFTAGGTTFTVTGLVYTPTTPALIQIDLDTAVNADLQALQLCAGLGDAQVELIPLSEFGGLSTAFALIPAGPTWSAGNTVELAIRSNCPPLSLRTDTNRVTEGESLTITGTLGRDVVNDNEPTAYTAYSNQTFHDVMLELPGYLEPIMYTSRSGNRVETHQRHPGFIGPGSDTFEVKVTAADDAIAEQSPKPVTITVLVDLDRDGTFMLEKSIDITVVDNDDYDNAIDMSASSGTTLTEGGGFVTVTLRVTNPAALPADGVWVRVMHDASSTANVTIHPRPTTPNWDYWFIGAQEEKECLDRDCDNLNIEVAAYFKFTPTESEHTLKLRARHDNVAERPETIILTAVDVNNPALRGTLTLTIQNRSPGPTPGPPRTGATESEVGVVHRSERSAPQPLYAPLIADVQQWRNDPNLVFNKDYTDRWDRVLLALGEPVSDTSLSPMPVSEAQGYAYDQGWSRWVAVAEALDDVVTGTSGPDTLQGTGDDDLLVGLDGADTLSGLGGNDELRGGDGDDTYTGGAGRDRFVFFTRETGAKAITDFASGDVIVLKGSGWPSAGSIIASVKAVGIANYRYTLTPGLTVETTNNRPLRTEDFVHE